MTHSQCCHLKNSFQASLLSPPSSSSFSSSSSSHPMLQLLGLSDQELQEQMAKGHSFAFNMGNNNIIPFKDFQEAAKVLMERNMPDILHNTQTEAVFMPETHLPNMPRVVDEQRYEARKDNLPDRTLQFLGTKKGTEDLQVATGDLAEKELSEELHKFYKNKEVVAFCGPKLRLPGKGKGGHQEFDFVIIDLKLKTGIVSDKSAAAQTQRLKELLEQFFTPELSSSDL